MSCCIIRGTTPAIKYTFSKIAVSDIDAAILSITKDGETIIEKEIDTAYIGDTDITWILSQAETLSLPDQVGIMLNWLLKDGTRGASDKTMVPALSNYINEVIT